jgi:hypothetical protein
LVTAGVSDGLVERLSSVSGAETDFGDCEFEANREVGTLCKAGNGLISAGECLRFKERQSAAVCKQEIDSLFGRTINAVFIARTVWESGGLAAGYTASVLVWGQIDNQRSL